MNGQDTSYNLEILKNLTINYEGEIVEKLLSRDILTEEQVKEAKESTGLLAMYERIMTLGMESISKLYKCFIDLGLMQPAEILRPRITCHGYGYYGGESGQSYEPNIGTSQERYDNNISEVYKMGSHPKGLSLVIRCHFFERKENEASALRKESQKITTIVSKLGYSTTLLSDLSKHDLEEAIQNFRMREEHNTVDSLVVVLLFDGHEEGLEQFIWTKDGQLVPLNWIISQLDVPVLINKPKVFFLQSTRGMESKIFSSKCLPKHLAEISIMDALIVSASYPVDTYNGGFVELISSEIVTNACRNSLRHMLNSVAKIMEKIKYENGPIPLIIQSRSFDRELFFHPGLYDRL